MPVSVMQHSEVSICLFDSMYTTGSAATPAGAADASVPSATPSSAYLCRMNENRPNNVGQYILVQRTPNKCGAFCHDDCIGSAELCLTCLIR
ncbi:Additional sex combs [Operophtera brumata]|uniref:Additional sex combs n=1 Tax=Operophtera brumata TaxID=104452 RepID=A0A0L7KQE9_OPEBR|nr:Additional sex combs [Operophtera brumata]